MFLVFHLHYLQRETNVQPCSTGQMKLLPGQKDLVLPVHKVQPRQRGRAAQRTEALTLGASPGRAQPSSWLSHHPAHTFSHWPNQMSSVSEPALSFHRDVFYQNCIATRFGLRPLQLNSVFSFSRKYFLNHLLFFNILLTAP